MVKPSQAGERGQVEKGDVIPHNELDYSRLSECMKNLHLLSIRSVTY